MVSYGEAWCGTWCEAARRSQAVPRGDHAMPRGDHAVPRRSHAVPRGEAVMCH